jgi:hypothetical protein
MIKSAVTPLVLTALLASFAIGWRAPAASTPAGLVAPLNLTLSEGTLFVSDPFTGVHVYDVADPSAPRAVTTIALEGNRGTAVKDDILYASAGNSLLVYRRTGDTFDFLAELEPEYDYDSWNEGGGTAEFKGGDGSYYYGCTCGSTDLMTADSAPTPQGSSYATFALIDDYLYRVDHFTLVVYDIAAADQPKEVARKYFGWAIETIYPTEQFLFVGGTQGMYIFNRSDPAAPQLIGQVQHFRACDPVVVSGDVAYVTLRGGNACGATNDVLLCVSIADPSNPRIVAEKALATPYGLAVREPFLFVSTGQSGYALLDVTRPTEPSQLAAWSAWATKDFLWSNDVLYVLGFDDLRIYDVSDPKVPVLRSTIASGSDKAEVRSQNPPWNSIEPPLPAMNTDVGDRPETECISSRVGMA